MNNTEPHTSGSAVALSNQEAFARHATALRGEHIEDLLATFAEDAVVIAHKTIYRGHTAIEDVFRRLFSELPHATWEVERVWADSVLFVEWKARASAAGVGDGVDTFVFRDGKIQIQTIHYTLG